MPKSSAGHAYILAATDYFSKWAEAVALKEKKKENVADFLCVHIVYRFGIPRYILTDNGKPFDNKLMDKICNLFDFKQRNSSAYYAAANGLAEAFNKTLCNLLKKVVSKLKRIGMTEWKKLCGQAVLPLERQIPSLRLAIQEGLTDEENAKLRLAELEALDEKRLQSQQSLKPIIVMRKTGHKFTSRWDGPYVIQEVYTGGAYKLISEDGLKIGPINGRFL
ncbi:PREDICTED: uncharacterized protein LOC109153774 [Ipomoea nil]|uniref:uncharacterized protein LOC109153774 n=1 Tax=Ipomoea nil TaxID=35883 RepID=UPI000900D8F7|nr:PREDICTED: uncharacterized protein LOC109153774 [Ipomoea nil]